METQGSSPSQNRHDKFDKDIALVLIAHLRGQTCEILPRMIVPCCQTAGIKGNIQLNKAAGLWICLVLVSCEDRLCSWLIETCGFRAMAIDFDFAWQRQIRLKSDLQFRLIKSCCIISTTFCENLSSQCNFWVATEMYRGPGCAMLRIDCWALPKPNEPELPPAPNRLLLRVIHFVPGSLLSSLAQARQ